ncbi:MAG: hypothetical protein Q7K65_03890 [Candidatus Buchananbacteria bacterium]|nr:hypothetical protein [Candidatus Buchananbacteria bacterium]
MGINGIEIEIDFLSIWNKILVFGSQNPVTIAIDMFLNGGWVVLLLLFIYGLYTVWLDSRRGQFASKIKHILLAIDIPKNNIQTPKAVESVFIALAGAQGSGNLVDIYWRGKIQDSFSFEIVSLESYVQFLVRTPKHFRDLIEAAIYAQYPEAEITEVADYAEPYKDVKFPNNKYDLWGTEFLLARDYPYPIRTYLDFEHKLTGELLDPMAGLLEMLTRIGVGEQIWLQFVVTPQKPGWGEKGKKILKEMKGEPYAPPATIADKLLKPVGFISDIVMAVTSEVFGPSEPSKKKEEDQWKMFRLSPGERIVFENIQKKLSQHAFRIKFRFVYFGEKDVFNKARGVASVIAGIQQFNVADSNGFMPGPKTKTSADYFRVGKRVAERQRRILKNYIKRSNFYGDNVKNMFLCSQELASLWHFPVMSVKAPTVEKIGSKRAVPPSRLPYASTRLGTVSQSALVSETPITEVKPTLPESRPEPKPPANLPTV